MKSAVNGKVYQTPHLRTGMYILSSHLAPLAVQRRRPVCCIDTTNDESSYTAANPCTIMSLQTGLDSDGALGTATSLTGYELDICAIGLEYSI